MTVPVMSAKMEELVSMESTPTTVSVTQNSQVWNVLSYNVKIPPQKTEPAI